MSGPSGHRPALEPALLRPRSLRAALLLLVCAPGQAAAQTGPALGQDGAVGAALSIRSGVTWLSNRPLPIAAVAGTLRLSTTFELGGEGVLGLGAVRLSPADSPDRSKMEMGYGGILVRWRPAGDAPGLRWAGGLLIGAGAAGIKSPLSSAPVVSENYFLVEPRFDILLSQERPLRFFAEGGYRVALGADPLPGIRLTELRGATLSLAIQYVLDP